ncbi:MAG TPA: serine/threonine-protein kinase, partial [Kofleriaceae bacterium]|nr:serine/threonine-protein kinase [Kofleriaceae bacterium]
MQDPFIGTVLDGRYEILAKIGEGGMGVVYKARQVSIDRVIAIKVLNSQMAADPQWVQRFSNEARACSRLQHPNTIKMFDFGQTADGRFFMTMEFLDGQVLRQAIQNSAPMQPARVMRILVQCCASLAEAHSIGIIHRDIKPDNVFLMNMPGSPDFVKLLDFSVAKLLAEGGGGMKTQAGVVFGTPQYMSPEQGRGMPLDARSDLYALGILGYEMLTGQVPFNDDNPMAVLQMHLRAEVPPLPAGLPSSVVNVVRKALEKDPGRRFQSSGEMMQVCQQVLTELNAGAAASQVAAQAGPPPQVGGPQKTMIAPGVGGPGLPGMPPPPAAGPMPGMAPPA